MHLEPQLLQFNEEDTSKKASLNETIEDFFDREDFDNMLMCMDFDNTMVTDDAGVQVFLHTLINPNFWKDSPLNFTKLLLPKKYRRALESGQQEDDEELDCSKCDFILKLAKDISVLYREIRKLRTEKELDISSQELVSEFALKMIVFDEEMMKLDSIFSKRFNGDFLLRTRFFKDCKIDEIKRIAQDTYRQLNEFIDLIASSELQTDQEIILTSKRIPARPRVNLEVLETARTILSENNGHAIPRVITTNLPAIPRSIIRSSDWAEILEHEERFRLSDKSPLVMGTRLRMDRYNIFQSKPEGLPVAGKRKQDLAEMIAKRLRRRVRVVIGDSIGDFEMGLSAVRNNGLFLIASPEASNPIESIEKSRQIFRERLRNISMENHPGIMLITPEDL